MVVGVGLIMSGFLGGIQMHVEHGFGPVWNAESHMLVLGSMPSPKSREMNFYYGHSRNRFWPVMAAVFHDDSCLCENTDPIQTVRTRKGFALRHHMALWDVIASCDIEGASDASIRTPCPTIFPICSGSRKSPIYLPLARRLRSCTSDSAFRYYRRMGRTMCR